MVQKIPRFSRQQFTDLSLKHIVAVAFVFFLTNFLANLLASVFSLNLRSAVDSWPNPAAILFLNIFIAGSVAIFLVFWFAKHLRREILLDRDLHTVNDSYQALTNQTIAGVAKVDAVTGHYLSVNQRLCEMVGYTADEMLGMTLYDITHPDDRNNVKENLTGNEDSPIDFAKTFQKRYVHKNGMTIHAVVSSHVVKNAKTGTIERLGLIQDISASIKNQRILKEQENRLSIIIHNSMDAIITIDAEEIIIIFNAAAETMFGYLAQDALKMSLSKLIPQSFRAAHHRHVQQFSRSGDTARKMGTKIILKGLRASGEEFPIDASISRAISDGKVYMTVILRDLTEQVKAQNELDSVRRDLRVLSVASQTAREEEKSRISRELHDDLGQNLTALKMDLSWLLSHKTNDVEAYAERIRAMQLILDSTIVSTRRIAADLRPVMLDDLGFKAAIDWLTRDFTRRFEVQCKVVIDEDVVELDTQIQAALYRVVQECLTNITRHAYATQVHIELRMGKSEVILHIGDNGVGMGAEAANKHGSFGLIGMRERIYILGGSVTINSQSGKGTNITIELPRSSSKQELSSPY
jgi:PAS domain S-box-containing protein